MSVGVFRLWWIGCVLLSCLASSAAAQDRDRDRDREGDDEPIVDGPDRGFPEQMPRLDPRIVPPRPDRPDRDSRWYLGVEVDYRDYGAVITRVMRQSPAQRAGLEPRDVIVTVRGYQVGYVDNRLYPLDRELDLRADRRGNVLLLVQNLRNATLTNIPVRLQRAERSPVEPRVAPLIGTVTARRIGQLPRDAVLTVRLIDMTDRAAPHPITQRRYDNLGPLPIPFELDYDPDQIEPGRSYALQAAVVVNGIPTYQTERYKVFSNGVPQRVDMVLESAR